MNLFERLFGKPQPTSAQAAKDRLSIIIARESHDGAGRPADFLPALQRELIEVISKYTQVNADDIKVALEKQNNYEVLEVKIELPELGR